MKKITLLFIILFCTNLTPFAQSGKNNLSVSFGPSIPIGDFGASSALNANLGYAKTGVSLSLVFTHKLNSSLGIEAMLYGQQNMVNSTALTDQLTNSMFFHDLRHYNNWTMLNNHWSIGALMVGISNEWQLNPKSKKLAVIPKAMIGIAYAELPKLKAESRMDTAYAVFSQSKLKGFGASFLIGSSLKYYLTRNVGLLFSVEYFTTSKIPTSNVTTGIIASDGGLIIPELYQIQNSRNPPISEGYISKSKQPVSGLNAKIGISLWL